MPIQLKTKKRIESAALPGVAFTVRRLSHMRRASRDLDTMPAQVRIARLIREWREIMDADRSDLSDPLKIAAKMDELEREQRERTH